MVATLEHPRKLSNAQALMLQLFERELPEEDLKEMRNILAKFLFKKAELEAEKSMKANGLTLNQLNKDIEEINNGNRTDHLKKLRAEKNESSN